MSSGVASFGCIRFEDLNFTRGYKPWAAYGQSKLADLLMGQHLARLAQEHGCSVVSTIAHPGYTGTNLRNTIHTAGVLGKTLSRFDFLPAMEAEQGAGPLLFAATDPGAVNGEYYGPDGRFGLTEEVTTAKPPRAAKGPDLARSLWAVAEDLTGVATPRCRSSESANGSLGCMKTVW